MALAPKRRDPPFRYPPNLLPVFRHVTTGTYIVRCRVCETETRNQEREARAAFLRRHRRCGFVRGTPR